MTKMKTSPSVRYQTSHIICIMPYFPIFTKENETYSIFRLPKVVHFIPCDKMPIEITSRLHTSGLNKQIFITFNLNFGKFPPMKQIHYCFVESFYSMLEIRKI